MQRCVYLHVPNASLYKFHKSAFSWRNIELTPEIIDINKAPQLRELISLITQNLSNYHITEIISGLYSFKFRKKISEEISFLSKISEREAAAFNFTLDESLSLKRHYKKVLEDIEVKYRDEKNNKTFINSISFIHMIIGDFHFYDEEYNDAIVEYMEALQNLRNIEFSEQNASFFVLYIRNMLKLAYALEKRKSYVAAFMIYGQLVSSVVKFREIDLNLFGLEEKSIDSNSKAILKMKIFKGYDNLTSNKITVKDNQFFNNSSVLVKKKNQSTKIVEKYHEQIKFETLSDDDIPVCFSQNFSKLLNGSPFTALKEGILFGISSYEGIRLIYQPLIAKFQMIEKAHLGGIRPVDLLRLENEYKFIIKTIEHHDKFLIVAEFWCKVGDILYYKNGLMPMSTSKSESTTKSQYYCWNESSALCCRNSNIEDEIVKKGYNAPCISCKYYMNSLKTLCIDFLNLPNGEMNGKKIIPSIYDKMRWRAFVTKNSTAIRIMANTLSAVGNNFLSCCSKSIFPRDNFWDTYFHLFSMPERYEKIEFHNDYNKMEEVFMYYYLSYGFYVKSGQYKEACIQILKILYIIRDMVKASDSVRKLMSKKSKELKTLIQKNAAKNFYRAYYNVHRLEAKNYQQIFCDDKFEREDCVKLEDISLSADLKEYIQVFDEIQLFCGVGIFNTPEELIKKWTATPYSPLNRIYNRINDLKFKTMVNYNIFRSLKFTIIMETLSSTEDTKNNEEVTKNSNMILNSTISSLKKDTDKEKKIDEKIIDRIENLNSYLFNPIKITEDDNTPIFQILEFLITDSIFGLQEIIRSVKIYGVTYMVNYSILAFAHKKMGQWCKYFHLYRKYAPNYRSKKILEELIRLIGEDQLQYISTIYHFEQARDAYYSIFQLHSEGKAYKDMIDNMFYLNDDFNDTTYHFNAAAERYRINTDLVKNSLDDVRNILGKSRLYTIHNDRPIEDL